MPKYIEDMQNFHFKDESYFLSPTNVKIIQKAEEFF